MPAARVMYSTFPEGTFAPCRYGWSRSSSSRLAVSGLRLVVAHAVLLPSVLLPLPAFIEFPPLRRARCELDHAPCDLLAVVGSKGGAVRHPEPLEYLGFSW